MTLLPLVKIEPTSYPAINAILGLVLSNVQAVIGAHFHGMYLFGSLASGGFNPQVEIAAASIQGLSRALSNTERLGATVTTDSEQPGYAAAQVLDGKPAARAEEAQPTAPEVAPRQRPKRR